jgi:hypothetical protein
VGENSALTPDAMLCGKRHDYVKDSVYLNYLNTLVQNINTISVRAAAPTDIPSALKLLLATTNYSVTDKVKTDADTLKNLEDATTATCRKDIGTYAADFYGSITLPGSPADLTPGSDSTGITTFAFLGPIGTLVDTFLSILQPILINWATLADEMRRQQAIMTALSDQTIQSKINTAGTELANAVDTFATQSRHGLTGAFIEQLTLIKQMKIDVKDVDACKQLKARQTNGIPDATFIGCFSAVWTKLQGNVANLNTIGDTYDTLADANTHSAKTLFNQIMTAWATINKNMSNGAAPYYTQAFLSDLTEFITLAQAVASAASKSNLSALNQALAAVTK